MERLKLRGRSIAGLETRLEVPSFKLLLDLGNCSLSATKWPLVLLSHGHLDHMAGVPQHAARRAMTGMSEGIYVVPREVAPQVEALFKAAGELDGRVIPRQIVALGPDEEFPLDEDRFVRPIRTFHTVPSQGYTVWERRHRLQKQYRDAPGERLAELRRSGVVIDEPYEAPLFSFTGDTTIDVLEANPELESTGCLIIEASFLDERLPKEDAHRAGHVHLDDLVALEERLPKGDIVLVHFSARYEGPEVPALLRARLSEELVRRVRVIDNETGEVHSLA